MKYVSTRGAAPVLDFADVLLAGLAADGGLYVPEAWPILPPGWDRPRPYAARAADVLWPYVEGSPLTRPELDAIVADAYATFDHPDVCPVVEVEPGIHVVELFHGPTLAFKDVALQVVGRLLDHELSRRGRRATVVVATSGDTGSAAIAACVGRPMLDVVVLHPAGRVSDVQRRQMTTVDAPNVHNVAIEGTFDDCQDLVKALFADAGLRERVGLSAMNSINWARVAAQVPYHLLAAAVVGRCDVAVPTGNFGNAFAGWIARRGGAPVERLVIGCNSNDVLARWATTGDLARRDVVPTLSPSMDIQVSSNHERLLFELLGRDGSATAELMGRFRRLGSVEVPSDPAFVAASLDDRATLDEIAGLHRRTGYLVDPHTAVGIGAARRCRAGGPSTGRPVVCMATAHPAKFPDAVERATGVRPALPDHLADLATRPERYDVLPADPATVSAYVERCVAHR
ncbi:MAG TPA: threonine synthase [Acidimicrobiales bacterium]|nr:threonine synthase [Acidimicrobiales bacterium]